MPSSKKKPASFKYCSKRRKPGCNRAKKTCSYSKNRTPKCQPRKQSKKTKKSTKKTKKSVKKSIKSAKKYVKGSTKKSAEMKTCQRFKKDVTCRATKDAECAWDPKKNPKCLPKETSVFDLSVSFESKSHKLKFTYPVTEFGAKNCMFVVHTVGDSHPKHKLYLRYSKRLLGTMKAGFAKSLKAWWYCSGVGVEQQERRIKAGEADDVSHRIGNYITLTDKQLADVEALMGDCDTADMDELVEEKEDASDAGSDSGSETTEEGEDDSESEDEPLAPPRRISPRRARAEKKLSNKSNNSASKYNIEVM